MFRVMVGFFKAMVTVVVFDSLSLLVDTIDVARYARGDRTPATTLEDA